MGLDDLEKQVVNTYKKWFMNIADKTDAYINDAIETMGDPFKYNGLTNNLRKSSITGLTDNLNDIQEYKEASIKRINNFFEKAQKTDGDIIDEIRPLYQQALDRINTGMENVSIYEQQLVGLKNAEKYKEGTKAFNRGFNNVRGEELVRQEIEIEDIWDKGKKEQQKLYDDMNKRYTQTYHPEIENTNYFSERTSAFLDDDALKRYETLKQIAPGMIITEQSYNWETDIDRAHELALRENNQFDFKRQAEEEARRRVNNTTQNQVNREPKKRRKSYADRTTKPINSEFNNTFYGRYNMQTGDYEYADYKSHYSGGVSRSVYDEEWIWTKQLGEIPDTSEYGIEAPWSTNRARNTNVPDTFNTPDVPDASSAPKARKLKNATKSYRPEIKMEGNNVEIDSIYNHSVPRRIHNSNNTHSPEQNELDQEINRTETEHRQRTSEPDVDVPKPEPDVNTPDPEPYKPKIGDNVINSETGERYVLNQIDKANPDLDIHKDTYYYSSPNGETFTRTSPIDPNVNSNYKLDYDDMLSPDDVRRISNSFNDLETNTDFLEKAKSKLSSLKDQFDNGADNLNEIYQTEKSIRHLESKVANIRMQIDEDDLRYNSNGKYVYNINDKTRNYMDKADNLLGNYSETKYVNDYKEIFKEVKPRQFINSIDPGVDDAFDLINEAGVENNIKARTRTRGKKKNAQLTGRGNKKRRIQNTGRGNKNIIKTGSKKTPTLKRRGKSSKLRAVGRNGKVLNNIPRKAIPLNKKDIIKTAANLIVNEAATNTANTIIKNIDDINTPNVNNAPHPDSSDIPSADNPIPEPDHSNTPEPESEIPSGYSDDPSTWTDEDIADMADGDPELYEELKKRREEAFNNNVPETYTNTPEPENNSGPQGEPISPKPFSKNFDPNDPDTWTRDDIERMNNPSIWTDDDIKLLADGDPDYAEELKARKGTNDGPRQGPDDFRFHTDDAPIPERNKIDTPDTKMFDEDGLPKGLSKMDIAMTGLNILGAVGDYKSARREGHGVVSSAVRAGAKFAIDEALGWWALPIGIVKTLPGAAIKGADMLYKENRRMNSAANFQVFGDAQFMDTQQLATMRQSGMEMAKMAQYNLQQTLMGSEAKYLHR